MPRREPIHRELTEIEALPPATQPLLREFTEGDVWSSEDGEYVIGFNLKTLPNARVGMGNLPAKLLSRRGRSRRGPGLAPETRPEYRNPEFRVLPRRAEVVFTGEALSLDGSPTKSFRRHPGPSRAASRQSQILMH